MNVATKPLEEPIALAVPLRLKRIYKDINKYFDRLTGLAVSVFDY